MENFENPVNYLRICFDAFYYLGVFPCRFKLNESTGKFNVVTHPVQRKFCQLNFCFAIMFHVFETRKILAEMTDKDDPLIYFKLASIISGTLFWFTVFISIWWRSAEFLHAMNHLQSLGMTFHSTKGKKAKYLTPIILCTILAYEVLNFCYACDLNKWNPAKSLQFFKSAGMKIFFLEEFSSHPVLGQSIPFNILFALLSLIFSFSCVLLETFGEILLLNAGLCLSDLVDEFSELTKERGASNTKVLTQYESLRQVSNSLNAAVGVAIFGEVLTSLPYFVSNFVDFIHLNNLYQCTLHLIEFGNIFGFVLLATNVNRKANAIEEWILDHQNLSHLPLHEINILLHNISSKSIVFNGSGFFQITSGFLGSFVSLLLTFSVILIQFKDSSQSED